MFYLQHFFNPDFNHKKLAPKKMNDGTVNYHALGYVQNVVAGQILAECVSTDIVPPEKRDPRFIFPQKHLPIGPNCAAHPENPDKIIATANGYCFYHDGLITVKKLLNIRGNVGFHTGNIFFVGDMAIHGDVQTGFAVKAVNILVKGHIESSKIKAIGDVVCLNGVKGASATRASQSEGGASNSLGQDGLEDTDTIPTGLIDAQGSIRVPFGEHIQLRAQKNIIIDGSCLHSTMYAGGNVVIKGRMQGGVIYANKLVYIEKQLGGDYTVPTRIMMGYDPFNSLKLQKLESQIKKLRDKLSYFEQRASRNHVMEQEYLPRIEVVSQKLTIAIRKRRQLLESFAIDEENAHNCRIIVPGVVHPGSEISIGNVFYKTTVELYNVNFHLGQDEIVITSPAISCAHKCD